MGLALTTLLAVGRIDLAPAATFGAFASLYGGGLPTASRWLRQAALGAVLTSAVATGAITAVTPGSTWLAVLVSAGWAAGAAAMSDRWAWTPPGPMFPVFAAATCAQLPLTVGSAALSVAVAATTAALAVALGVLEQRWWPVATDTPLRPPGGRGLGLAYPAVCAAAVALAGVLATLADLGHSSWAMVTSTVPLSAFTYRAQVVRGVQRALGTLAGLVVAAPLLFLRPGAAAVIALVVLLQAAVELLVRRNYGLAMVAVTPLALLVVGLGTGEAPVDLLASRLWETALGLLAGLSLVGLTASVGRRRGSHR